MDLVSDLEWLYRQDLVKIHHGQLPFLGLSIQKITTALLMATAEVKLLAWEVQCDSVLVRNTSTATD